MVSPFEKRRLSPKGQKFLRVVCPKADSLPARRQRFRVGDPSTRYYSLGMTDRVGRRDSGVTTRAQPCVVLKKPYDANSPSSPSSWRSVRRGRSMVCEETNDCPLPPVGSRGRGPWSGRGSQRVKPRLVSPFEKRRLFCKGQGFLRVVCPKARFYLPRWQRFRVGDPSARSARSG